MDPNINRKGREEDEDDVDMEDVVHIKNNGKEKSSLLNKSGNEGARKRKAPTSDEEMNTNEQLAQPSTSNGNKIIVPYRRGALRCVAILPSYGCYRSGLSSNYGLSSDSGSSSSVSTDPFSSSDSDSSLDSKKRKRKKIV